MSPRMWVWAVTWENECNSRSRPSVNVVSPDIAAAIVDAGRWMAKEENSDLNPDDCTMVSVVRGVEIEG